MRQALLLGAAAAILRAQTPPPVHPDLRWYTEFKRPGPDGEPAAPDRAGGAREVLSPAVPRNGHATFHLVVTAPPGKQYNLYFGANPELVVRHTVYREHFVKDAAGWIPDRIEEVKLPLSGVIPAPGAAEGQTVDVFLVDLFIPGQSAVRRVRVEAQLNAGNDWIVSPLELRLQTAAIPLLTTTAGAIAPAGANSGETPYSVLRGYLCGKNEKYVEAEPGIRAFLRRNASQDVALARSLESKAKGGAAVRDSLAGVFGEPDVKTLCAQPRKPPPAYNPENYIKVRDYLYRLAAE